MSTNNTIISLKNELNDMLRSISIRNLCTDCIKVPSKNDTRAVVRATVSTSEFSASDIGVAYFEDGLSLEDALEIAKLSACLKALDSIQMMEGKAPASRPVQYEPQRQSSPNNPAPSQTSSSSNASVDKSKWNGGGDKPMSDSQRSLISKQCMDNRMSVDEAAQRFIGKGFNQFTGSDANILIRKLNEYAKEEGIY